MPLVYLNYNGENDSTYDKSQFDSPLAWTSSNWLIFPRFVLSSLVNFRFTNDILELFYCSQVKHTLSQWSPGKGRCNCVKIIPNNGYSFIESISLFFCPVFRSSAKFSLFETHRVHSFNLFEILDYFVRNERRTKTSWEYCTLKSFVTFTCYLPPVQKVNFYRRRPCHFHRVWPWAWQLEVLCVSTLAFLSLFPIQSILRLMKVALFDFKTTNYLQIIAEYQLLSCKVVLFTDIITDLCETVPIE